MGTTILGIAQEKYGDLPRDTGMTVAKKALADLELKVDNDYDPSEIKLVIVFCSTRKGGEEYDLQSLIDGIREELGKTTEAPLIGATTAGEIYGKKVEDDSVICVLIYSRVLWVGVGSAEVKDSAEKAGANSLSQAYSEVEDRFPNMEEYSERIDIQGMIFRSMSFVLSFFSFNDVRKLPSEGSRLVQGMLDFSREHTRAGYDIPIVGGVAGDQETGRRSYVFHNDNMLTDAVVCAFFLLTFEKFDWGFGLGYNIKDPGQAYLVTDADDNAVYEVKKMDERKKNKILRGENSFKVLFERMRDVYAGTEEQYLKSMMISDGERAVSETYINTLCRPFGIFNRSGTQRTLRAIVPYEVTGESIKFAIPICKYDALYDLTPGEEKIEIEQNIRNSIREALENMRIRKEDISALFVFSCAIRRWTLNDDFELRVIREEVGDIPVVGFYTYGEMNKPVQQNSEFLNLTVSMLAVGKDKS